MNKLITKIVGVALGLTMAVGVGTATGASRRDAVAVKADGPVTIRYSGSSTTNMTGNNDAATLGLSSSDWTVVGNKGSNSNYPGLNKDGTIRLYYTAGGSNYIVVTKASGIITTITPDVQSGTIAIYGGSSVSGTPLTANNGTYTIGGSSFTIYNAATSNVQLKLNSVSVNYQAASSTKYTVTYSDGSDGTYSVENISDGSTHALLDFAATGLSTPGNKMFKCWSISGVERLVGYNLTVNSNITVTAVFTDKLSITYKANNGVEPKETDVVTYFASGTDQTIANNSTTNFTVPTNYVFNGWYTTASGTGGTAYAAGSIQTALSSSLTLYAQWQKVGPTVSFNLSTNSYNANPTTDLIVWEDAKITMQNAKGTGTNVTNYIPTANTSTRFYNGNILTITPASGYEISSATFTATTSGYATALKNSTWTNATANAQTEEAPYTVIVTPTNGESAFSAAIGGTCGFTNVTFQFAVLKTFTITSLSNEVEVNDITQVEANVPGVVWSSSDETIATVDEDGYVEGKKTGTVTIIGKKAGYEDASIEIEVIESTQAYINLSLTVDNVLNKNTGFTGQTFSVTATYANLESEPDSILWSTSGTGTVTRTKDETGDTYSGTLTTAGTARITATDANGDTNAYVEITITASEITSFTIDKSSIELFDDESETITASITATGIYDESVTWTSADPLVACVDNNGVVSAESSGTTTITATASDGSTRTCSVVVVEKIIDNIHVDGSSTMVSFIGGTDLGSTSANNSPDKIEKNGVTIDSTDAAFATAEYRCYKDSATTISVSGTITSISFDVTNKYSASDFEVNVGTLSGSTWTGSSSSVTFTATSQVRLDQIDVTYTPRITYSNSHDYFDAQKTVLIFSSYLTSTLEGVCVSANYSSDAFVTQWGLVANKYDELFGNGTELSSKDLAAAKLLLKNATSDYNGDTLQKAMARYDFIISHSDLTAFMVDGTTPLRSANVVSGLMNNIFNSNSTAAIIVIVSLVSITAIGGYFFIRKRKEQ